MERLLTRDFYRKKFTRKIFGLKAYEYVCIAVCVVAAESVTGNYSYLGWLGLIVYMGVFIIAAIILIALAWLIYKYVLI